MSEKEQRELLGTCMRDIVPHRLNHHVIGWCQGWEPVASPQATRTETIASLYAIVGKHHKGCEALPTTIIGGLGCTCNGVRHITHGDAQKCLAGDHSECESFPSEGTTPQAERPGQEQEFYNSTRQVMFRAGLLACREYMARFVGPESPSIAASIRANWWPSLGADPGVPRKLRFDEVTDGGEEGPYPAKEISPSVEALPVAEAFLIQKTSTEARAVAPVETRLTAEQFRKDMFSASELQYGNGEIDLGRVDELMEAFRYKSEAELLETQQSLTNALLESKQEALRLREEIERLAQMHRLVGNDYQYVYGSRHQVQKELAELRVKLTAAEAEAAALRERERWMRVPNEQAWWWHWDAEDYHVPHIYSVMVSKTGPDRYFVANGAGTWCDEMGGFWLKVGYPNVPSRDEQKALSAAPERAQ